MLVAGTLSGGQSGTTPCGSSGNELSHLVCPPPDPDRMREASGVPRQLDVQVREEPGEVCTCPDTPRYAALGDAMTVNVMEWIARRIRSVMG